MTGPLKILQVSTAAQGGGAERIAYTLHAGLRQRSQTSWMAVGMRNVDDPTIFEIPRRTDPGTHGARGPALTRRLLRVARSPRRSLDRWRGREDFDFPGTRQLLDLPPSRPDVIHCHNLHGSYFDLRALPELSRRSPVVMTLHDEWTFTGHCAATMGIENWRTGCHSCPDLDVYPRIRRDATHENWVAKRSIYRRSRLFVSTPSQWLMDRARVSILAEGAVGWRVIPNGVDRSTFRPGEQAGARRTLGVPRDARILLFTANQARRNMFKDYATVAEAARILGGLVHDREVLLIVLGEGGPVERQGNVEIRPVPYEAHADRVAAHYQAADLYVHAARTDNLPTTILEAAASGLPTVATAVGGIPEIVRSLAEIPGGWRGSGYDRDQATGALVDAGDAAGMARAAAAILDDDDLRGTLGSNAHADAAIRYDLERQVDATLAWYHEVLADWNSPRVDARRDR